MWACQVNWCVTHPSAPMRRCQDRTLPAPRRRDPGRRRECASRPPSHPRPMHCPSACNPVRDYRDTVMAGEIAIHRSQFLALGDRFGDQRSGFSGSAILGTAPRRRTLDAGRRASSARSRRHMHKRRSRFTTATHTLSPNSYGCLASSLPMHSTFGARRV